MIFGHSFAIGLQALYLLTSGSFDVSIGDGAGSNILGGSCNILIGTNINAPTPETSHYINVDGKEYPNSVRAEPWFQTYARTRSRQLVEQMYHLRPDEINRALQAVDSMPFNVSECSDATN